MKRILIILCSIMFIVLGLFVYNQFSGGIGKNRIEKVEQLRVQTKHAIKENKKEMKEQIETEGKDNEKRKDKQDKKKKEK